MTHRNFMLYDLETENLDPKRSNILEAACMLIDVRTLEIKDKRSFLCIHKAYNLDEGVRSMHKKSGLLDALAAAKDEIDARGEVLTPYGVVGSAFSKDYPTVLCQGHRELDLAMSDYAISLGFEGQSLTLIGTGIHFDRRFILEHCLHFNAFCHYQMTDLRSPLMLYDTWLKRWPKLGKAKHRAMADIEGAHQMLQWLKGQMAGPLSVVDTQELVQRIRESKDADTAEALGLRLGAALVLGMPEPHWLSPAEREIYMTSAGPAVRAREGAISDWMEALQ